MKAIFTLPVVFKVIDLKSDSNDQNRTQYIFVIVALLLFLLFFFFFIIFFFIFFFFFYRTFQRLRYFHRQWVTWEKRTTKEMQSGGREDLELLSNNFALSFTITCSVWKEKRYQVRNFLFKLVWIPFDVILIIFCLSTEVIILSIEWYRFIKLTLSRCNCLDTVSLIKEGTLICLDNFSEEWKREQLYRETVEYSLQTFD